MPDSAESRIAALTERVAGMQTDVQELRTEIERARSRLHDLEGVAGTLVDQERVRRRITADRQRRVEMRITMLTVVIAAASLLEPLLYHIATRR